MNFFNLWALRVRQRGKSPPFSGDPRFFLPKKARIGGSGYDRRQGFVSSRLLLLK